MAEQEFSSQRPTTGLSQGLIRPKRRTIKSGISSTVKLSVTRNYAIASETAFKNYVELKNDMISPDYAQEIIEEVMTATGIDMTNDKATRTFEDVVFTFFVQNAASQKTGYEKVVDIYGVEFDLMILLRTLVAHGVTPRRFTRGLADRIYFFLRAPENSALRVDIISKYSLDDVDHAAVAFDGSTHITDLTTNLRQVANVLASRGIYENEASTKNASERTTYDGAIRNAGVKTGTLHNGV